MSRNKQRVASSASPAPAQQVAPEGASSQPATLSYVTPTEFVELPSAGKFYSPEHSLYNEEVVEVRYMTAKDEDTLTSRSLLKKGLAIDRLLEGLIIDKSIKPNDLLLGDKNAILVAARVSGYGAEYPVSIKCASCEATSEHVFDLSLVGINYGIQPEEDDDSGVTCTDRGTFIAELPQCGFKIEFRMLTGSDETYLSQAAQKLNKLNLPDATATNLLKRITVSVNGVDNQGEIANFIENMPAQDSRHLRACIQIVTPNIDMTQTVECDSCGAITEMEVPFTAEFFWPR